MPFQEIVVGIPAPPIKIPLPEAELIQLIPSYEYAILLVPAPPATQIDPLNVIELQVVVKIAFPEVDTVQVSPLFVEYAITLVPAPPATQIEPLVAIHKQFDENVVEFVLIQVIPS